MIEDLAGKTALITGAAGGIGLGTAKVLARAGMNVVITDIKEVQLRVAEAELKVITENILALQVDSTDEASLEKAADVVAKHFGNLHVLFNNAGISGGDKILDTPDEKWRNVYEVNVYGPLNGIKQFLPAEIVLCR